MSRAILAILGLTRRLAPPALRGWADAAAREAEAIPDRGAALRFAVGCLFWAVREAAITQPLSTIRKKAMSSSAAGLTPAPQGWPAASRRPVSAPST